MVARAGGGVNQRDIGIGRTSVPYSADFIVLDANPLDDILNTRRINKVYNRGTALDRAAMSRTFTSEAN